MAWGSEYVLPNGIVIVWNVPVAWSPVLGQVTRKKCWVAVCNAREYRTESSPISAARFPATNRRSTPLLVEPARASDDAEANLLLSTS
jgi:hypothetical protein